MWGVGGWWWWFYSVIPSNKTYSVSLDSTVVLVVCLSGTYQHAVNIDNRLYMQIENICHTEIKLTLSDRAWYHAASRARRDGVPVLCDSHKVVK
jgi:hypothetical protein